MGKRYYFFMLMAGFLVAGCAHEAPKTVVAPVVAQKPALMDPFRYHKLIEVSPGEDFDVLSWGRGSSAIGSFEILHSDSVDMKYTTTTGDLEGSIVDVYNSDMDMDGNPEILIQAKAKDTSNYAIIYAFEFSNGKPQKLDFPKLTSSQRKGYHGGDNFYIQDGKFMREFPIYNGDGKDAKQTGAKRMLQYGLRNNEFTVKQLSKDSTDNNKTPVIQQVNSIAIKKSTVSSGRKKNSSQKSTSSKKKKHKSEEKKTTSHKKKKKHHHSNE